MQPGIYDISNDQYHSGPGISRSGIMEFRKLPFLYWHKYINGAKDDEEQTNALDFGNAVHTHILEPTCFNDRFVFAPKIDRRTTAGKLQYERFLFSANGKTILSDDFKEKLMGIKAAVERNQYAKDLIAGAEYEKSIYWNDEETGILCKCRPDIMRDNIIVDIKTCADASKISFRHSIEKYGYHIQAAMIKQGIKAVKGIEINGFIFIAIEKEPPYLVAIYLLDEQSLAEGEREFKDALLAYKQSIDLNSWPDYGVQEIGLRKYANAA